MTKFVGIGYRARQGKSTLTDAMVAAGNGKVKAYALAEELKRYCAAHHDELFEKYPDVAKTQKEDPIYGFTAMLQHYGTNVIRKENPNHWVEVLDKRISEEAPEIALVTDVRFPNEAEYIKAKGGLLIRIQRIKDGKQMLDPNRDPNHPSECSLDGYLDWDFLLDCQDGGVTQLQQIAPILVEAIEDANEDTPTGDTMPDDSVTQPDGDGTPLSS